MATLIEKGFHALVFGVFFFVLAYVLDTLAPSKPAEIYELYCSHINTLWVISSFFVVIFVAMLLIAITSKYGLLKNMELAAYKSSVVLGFIISVTGLVCIVYFLMQYIVFPWQQ